MATVYTKDVTGLPPIPSKRPRMSAEERAELYSAECQKIAAKLSIYQGDDIFIDMRGAGIIHDTGTSWSSDDNCGGVPEKHHRLRVTEHLVSQWQIHRNGKFAVVQHDDGGLLAVSLAEFVGLGKPEAQ